MLSLCVLAAPAVRAAQAPAGVNLARHAARSGSGRNLEAAVEGLKQRVDQGEWSGGSPHTWYGWIMKLGLFSLCGTSSTDPIYEITAPEFDEVLIPLDPRHYAGKTFTIRTHGNSPENVYIQKAELNGRPFEHGWFYHRYFAAGGRLELWLGLQPSQLWGRGPVR